MEGSGFFLGRRWEDFDWSSKEAIDRYHAPSAEEDLLGDATPSEPFYGPLPASENMRLRGHAPSSIHQYVIGWREAADAAFKHLVEDERDHGNYLGYAVAGIYRHACELALKDILIRAHRLEYNTDRVTPRVASKTHDLRALSDGLNALLESERLDEPTMQRWQKVRLHLQWWQASDPNGMCLRYPFSSDGAWFGSGNGTFDFARAILTARALLIHWEWLYAWIDAMEDNYAEMQAEARGWDD